MDAGGWTLAYSGDAAVWATLEGDAGVLVAQLRYSKASIRPLEMALSAISMCDRGLDVALRWTLCYPKASPWVEAGRKACLSHDKVADGCPTLEVACTTDQ